MIDNIDDADDALDAMRRENARLARELAEARAKLPPLDGYQAGYLCAMHERDVARRELAALRAKAEAFDEIARLTAEFTGADFAHVAADIGEIIQRATTKKESSHE